MKKLWYFIRNLFLGIAVAAALVLTLVWNVLTSPVQIYRYHRSHFYRDLGVKFRFYIPDTYAYGLYNRIREAKLPVEYLLPGDPGQAANGFFFYKDTLILHDFSEIVYSEKLGGWSVYPEDEESLNDTIADVLVRLQSERADAIVEHIVILMDRADLDPQDLPRAEADPLFLLHSGEDVTAVLAAYCQSH